MDGAWEYETHLLQPIQACIETKFCASLFKDITEILARSSLDRGPACGGVDDYHMRRHGSSRVSPAAAKVLEDHCECKGSLRRC